MENNSTTNQLNLSGEEIRGDFPIFANNGESTEVGGELIYLDNAATVQKSAHCIDGIADYLRNDYANIHRGDYELSLRSEELFWQSRKMVAEVMDVHPEEIIFTGNATDASNLLVQSLVASDMLQEGDLIALTEAEHHANIVPWQMAAKQVGAEIVWIEVDENGEILDESVDEVAEREVAIVAVSAVSNVTGTIVDVGALRKEFGDRTLMVVDASQAMAHGICDLKAWGADFCRRTGHKIGALPGIGVLRGKKHLLASMQPAKGGGGAIGDVTKVGYTLLEIPNKFEPGTPNLTGVLSLKLALEYLCGLYKKSALSDDKVEGDVCTHKELHKFFSTLEAPLIEYCLKEIEQLEDEGLILIGSDDPKKKIGLFTFRISKELMEQGKNPVALSQFLATKNICVRAGGQCAHPLHTKIGGGPTCRMSLWIYNTLEDCRVFFDGVREYLSE